MASEEGEKIHKQIFLKQTTESNKRTEITKFKRMMQALRQVVIEVTKAADQAKTWSTELEQVLYTEM